MSSIQVELMKPALFTISDDMDTIAVINRYIYHSEPGDFKYHDLHKHIDIIDSILDYRTLSNKCLDELANQLDSSGFFLKVINYVDTINPPFNVIRNTGPDISIFLNSFDFKDHLISGNALNLGQEIFAMFPEFRSSTQLETIEPNLAWIISIKGNSFPYNSKQSERLYYGNNLYPNLFGNDENHRLLLKTSAEYLGRAFTANIIPSWKQEERTYYRSNNIQLLLGEKYLLQGDWLNAAETYRHATKNKNPNIAAKATYNMGLVCEMEKNLDAATDWLIKSFSTYKKQNLAHELNCTQYIKLLAVRRQEILTLEKQIR